MSNGQDEFVTIRPRQVALSHQNDGPGPRGPISLGMVLTGAGLALLIAIAVWVFMYLPGSVERQSAAQALQTPKPAAPGTAKAAEPAATNPAVVVGKPPYEALQIDRERKRSQETLARFVKLQIKLDDEMHVRNWAAEEFNAAQQIANDGDELFTKLQFDAAMKNYEAGIAALEALRNQGTARFDGALAAAATAIDRRDAAAAETACAAAAAVYPDDARIADGRKRAKALPQIIELFDEANRATERNDWRTALTKYRAIQTLDPKTYGLQTALADAQSRVSSLDYQGVLSAGYAALEAGDYPASKRAFEAALRQRPNDAAASDGMNQAEQRATLSSIDTLREKAGRAEADERWKDAAADYDRVLTVDASIKFAMDGRARAGERAELDRKLQAAISDPGALSSDATYAATVQLYKDSVKIPDPGPRLTDQLNRLEKQLATASEPVQVTLTSDSATDVTISQLGALGKFARKEVRLRPGRYVVLGSRDGRRDIRREVLVTPQMAPVEIICQEAI
jgi:tetratricopeptide (TPR) repeat protein